MLLQIPAVAGLALVMLLLLVTMDVGDSFKYVSYCDRACKWGKGGNLCKCTAGHFVGKRNLPYDIFTRESRSHDVLPEAEVPTEDVMSLGESPLEEGINSELPFFSIKLHRSSKRHQFNSSGYDHSEEQLFEQ